MKIEKKKIQGHSRSEKKIGKQAVDHETLGCAHVVDLPGAVPKALEMGLDE